MNKFSQNILSCHADAHASKVKQLQFRGKTTLWSEAIKIKEETWMFSSPKKNFKAVSYKAQLCAEILNSRGGEGGEVPRSHTRLRNMLKIHHHHTTTHKFNHYLNTPSFFFHVGILSITAALGISSC